MRRRDTGARLLAVRWVAQGLVALVLVGCSRENPWFVLKGGENDSADSTGTSPNETSSGGTGGGSSGVVDTTAGLSGDVSSGDASSGTSTSGSTSTTSTTSTSTSEPGSSSSGDPNGTSGSSTGGMEQETVLYDFYEKCPDMDWEDISKAYACQLVPAPPISVSQTTFLYEAKKVSGVSVFPGQGPAGFLDGSYTVFLSDAVEPRFRSVLLFPAGAAIKDAIVGQIYVESVMNGATILSPEPIVLQPGGFAAIDLDLSQAQGEVQGLVFHLLLTIDVTEDLMARGVWIHPRIVHFP